MNITILLIMILMFFLIARAGAGCKRASMSGGSVRRLMHDELESGSAFNE